ncbi:hypothetical protein D9M69_646420 [compost metagenome]
MGLMPIASGVMPDSRTGDFPAFMAPDTDSTYFRKSSRCSGFRTRSTLKATVGIMPLLNVPFAASSADIAEPKTSAP